MKILNFGSLNIDYVYKVDHFVQKGETLLSDGLQVFPGGKGMNQSIAMGRAGLNVFHGGSIGGDGRFLLEILAGAGVDTSLVTVLEHERTGNAIIQNDREGDNCILLYGGANQAVTREQIDAALAQFGAGDWLVLQNEVNELPYLVEQAYARKMTIVLNPSPMNEKVRALNLSHIHWILLNEVEAAQLTGVRAEIKEELAARLGELYPQLGIVLTLGGDGSCCIRGGEVIWQQIYRVEAVDTTAAGDTFSGYFLAGLLGGHSVRESLDMASMASAIAVSKQGAEPSIPRLEQVQAALARGGVN